MGGLDQLHANVLKQASPFLAEPLSEIFNKCFELGYCPMHFKKAEIVPVFKNRSRTNVTNYRPISLISNLAKIFEKLLQVRLIEFFCKHNILSKQQFGFQKDTGCKQALATFTDFIYKNLDLSRPVIAVFIDLAKAFDTVNFDKLFAKLIRCGIRGLALELIRSYLTGRMQRVVLGKSYSSWNNVDMGVPQGSILGPLLFLIYINDIFDEVPEGTVFSFADDTSVMVSEQTWDETVSKMNSILANVCRWLNKNKLSLNLDKCVFITFANGTDMLPQKINIIMNNKSIKRVEVTKYLGLYVDCFMKWAHHIDYITKTLRYLVFVFKKLSKILSTVSLLKIFYALFNSIASYGIIAWGSAYENAVSSLVNLQVRILKIIFKGKIEQIKSRLILNVKQNYTLNVLMYNYDLLKNLYKNSESRTRNKIIALPYARLNVGKKRHCYKAIDIFNKLPNELKILNNSTQIIKKKIKKWLQEST